VIDLKEFERIKSSLDATLDAPSKEHRKNQRIKKLQKNGIKEAEIQEKCIAIKINRTYKPGMTEKQIYERTRGIWKCPGYQEKKPEYALAIYEGVVLEVYEIEGWFPALSTPYEDREDLKDVDPK